MDLPRARRLIRSPRTQPERTRYQCGPAANVVHRIMVDVARVVEKTARCARSPPAGPEPRNDRGVVAASQPSLAVADGSVGGMIAAIVALVALPAPISK